MSCICYCFLTFLLSNFFLQDSQTRKKTLLFYMIDVEYVVQTSLSIFFRERLVSGERVFIQQ